VARRTSKQQLAAIYGIKFPDWKVVEGQDLVSAYALSRRYYKDKGSLDDTRAARIVLKDFLQVSCPPAWLL
jgi:hypothetical protein